MIPDHVQGFSNLLLRISRLAGLKPLAINITWGAGGSTKDQTLELASLTQRDYGIDTVMHLTCTNMLQGSVDDALRVCDSLGVSPHGVLRCIGCERYRDRKHLGPSRRSARLRLLTAWRLLMASPRSPKRRRILDPHRSTFQPRS